MKGSANDIRMIVSDLDGVWTDGKIIYTGDARETKEFNVRDGLGVRLAQAAGLQVTVVTSRKSKAVERRCRELGITGLIQGAADKLIEVRKLLLTCELEPHEMLYVGDDLPDLAPMTLAGISAAPADAAAEVLGSADWQLASRGGAGAFRELVERLLRARGEWDAAVERFHGAKVDIQGI
ncbi:MAG: KdsC family phosphatase [Thermoanaerobaculia bacterium]